jgi:hypothetical protein
MSAPEDPGELDLVQRAITIRSITGSFVTGCCEWDEKAARRLRARPPLPGLTPEGIRDLLYDFVATQGGVLLQVAETRPEYQDRRFYYKAVIPVEGLVHGLFVEIVVDDDDPELPEVRLVNAHEQIR